MNANLLGFTHPRVQRLRRLLGRRSARLEENAFVVEGAKVVTEALASGWRIEALYVVGGTEDQLIERALADGVSVYDMAPGVMERVSDTVTPQPILAVVEMMTTDLDTLRPALTDGGFAVIGVDVRDPGNAGTLVRSAEAAGACGVVLCEGSVELTNPKTVRASAGSLFHLPVVSGPGVDSVLQALGAMGVRRWGTSSATQDAPIDYTAADLSGPTAIVVGNEAHGLPAGLDLDGYLTIPMAGRSESLNVGVATAVLCFEAARQRRLV